MTKREFDAIYKRNDGFKSMIGTYTYRTLLGHNVNGQDKIAYRRAGWIKRAIDTYRRPGRPQGTGLCASYAGWAILAEDTGARYSATVAFKPGHR